MDELRARRVVDSLRDRGVNAHLLRGAGQFGVRVPLPGGREAAPAPAAALPRDGGVFRRFLDGFRYK